MRNFPIPSLFGQTSCRAFSTMARNRSCQQNVFAALPTDGHDHSVASAVFESWITPSSHGQLPPCSDGTGSIFLYLVGISFGQTCATAFCRWCKIRSERCCVLFFFIPRLPRLAVFGHGKRTEHSLLKKLISYRHGTRSMHAQIDNNGSLI